MDKDGDKWGHKPSPSGRATGKEENLVTEMIQKLRGVNLPPHQLKELGLDKDWNKKVAPQFVERVVRTAEKYRIVLKELSKR
ncbi:MAG: hypothetical protein ACM3ZA_05780 [Bacillota bacterium]